MPPRKKFKRPISPPGPDDYGMDLDAPTPDVEEPNEPPAPAYEILKDPWTDEQETALFKGIIRWKPNGNGVPWTSATKTLTHNRHAQTL
jgi:MRG-binding protein